MKRIDALRVIEAATREWALVLTCGATAREMASLATPDSHLPLLDSMGLTSAVGLGIALGTRRRVGVVDGDGSLLMGFSILPTLGTVQPDNLVVVVLDNHQHASADEMESQAATIDLGDACEGFGFRVDRTSDEHELDEILSEATMRGEFRFVVVSIEPGNAPGVRTLLKDPAVLAERTRSFLAPR